MYWISGAAPAWVLPPARPAAGAAASSREMKQAAAGHDAVALQVLHRYSAATSAHLPQSMVSPDKFLRNTE